MSDCTKAIEQIAVIIKTASICNLGELRGFFDDQNDIEIDAVVEEIYMNRERLGLAEYLNRCSTMNPRRVYSKNGADEFIACAEKVARAQKSAIRDAIFQLTREAATSHSRQPAMA